MFAKSFTPLDAPLTFHPRITWEEIEQSIKALDGKLNNELTVYGDNLAHISISGGHDRFYVYATFDNEHFHRLRNPSAPAGESTIIAGDQAIQCGNQDLASLETVLQAARQFAEHGKLDPTLHWTK